MLRWKWITTIALGVSLSGCGTAVDTTKPPAPAESDDTRLLVSGEILHREDEPYSYQGPVVFTPDSHAVIKLSYMLYQDAGAEELARTVLNDINAFPIPFRLEGDPKAVFSRSPQGKYLLDVVVFMGPGDDLYIGDLLSEYIIYVDGPTSGLKVQATGLEKCDTPSSGGACAEDERP